MAKPRLTAGLWLLRLGQLIRSLSIMVMRPDDLIELNRRRYATSAQVRSWSEKRLVQQGLFPEEQGLLAYIPLNGGKILILGGGGGREAMYFARKGFQVTIVDFVSEMAENARASVVEHGFKLEALIQDITQLAAPENTYDLIWFSVALYSAVPSRQRRVALLQRCHTILRSDGYLALQFQHQSHVTEPGRLWQTLQRITAYLTRGNVCYEPGDRLTDSLEYTHLFSSPQAICAEAESGGFRVLEIQLRGARSHALLHKV